MPCYISATCPSDLAVWYHGIERLSGRVTMRISGRDSVPAKQLREYKSLTEKKHFDKKDELSNMRIYYTT